VHIGLNIPAPIYFEYTQQALSRVLQTHYEMFTVLLSESPYKYDNGNDTLTTCASYTMTLQH